MSEAGISQTIAPTTAMAAPPSDVPRLPWRLLRMYARALVADKAVLAACIFLIVLTFAAIFAGVIAPYDPAAQSLKLRNDPPLTIVEGETLPHLLGTDVLGRDQLSRLIYGARISLAVGLASALISGIGGVLLGLIAGYYRGSVDDLIMRLVDLQMAFPSLMVALLVLYAIGAGTWKVILVLAVTRWMVYARVTRAMVLSSRETAYVEAAHSTGCSNGRILFRHILPNLVSPLLVLATLEVATMMLAEASLSFLGLGIQPPETSWGLMLAESRSYITTAWWLVAFPGLAIFLTALSLNMLATWARTVTDPVLRWRVLSQ
jgi:peptide/nickel transport system permease protein